MKDYVYIGKIVDTHGIKGELRILSSFERKDIVFIPDNKLYLGNELEEKIISSYRHHKNFEMIVFEGTNNINEVLKYLKKSVYFKREDLKLNEEEYLIEDLIDYGVLENNILIGKVTDIVYNNSNILLSINGDNDFYIPLNSNYILKVDTKNKEIIVENTKGLIL